MKILHVVPGIEQISGGPSQAVVAICNALNQAGLESHIATTIDGLNRYSLVHFDAISDKVFFFERWKIEKFAFSRSLKEWLHLNLNKYNIVHIHSLFNYPSYIASSYAKKNNIPYIIRPAGALNNWAIQHKFWKKLLWMNLVEKSNLLQASSLHATSKQEAEYISKVVPVDRIQVIKLGIDLPQYEQINSRLPEQPLQLLFLSRINPKKNIPLLLYALKKVISRNIPVTLRIAGRPDPGMERYEQEIRQLVKQLGLSNIVTFIGFVEGEKKTVELKQSHVFVLPSYDENFGIAVVEAMAYGLPVIISQQVALAEDVHTNMAGLIIDCEDIDGLTDGIETLYKNENLRIKMSQHSRQLASQFSWSSAADALVHLYSKILQEK